MSSCSGCKCVIADGDPHFIICGMKFFTKCMKSSKLSKFGKLWKINPAIEGVSVDEPTIRSIFREELDRAKCEYDCPAIVVLHEQRRKIEYLERRISELESRPQIVAEPITEYFTYCPNTTCSSNVSSSELSHVLDEHLEKFLIRCWGKRT